MQLGGMSALFSVGATLREPCVLPRAGGTAEARFADVWRHKESTGIIAHEGGASQGPAIIVAEAMKQVDAFVASWRREAAVAQVMLPAVIAGAGMNLAAPVVAGPAVVAAPAIVPTPLVPPSPVAGGGIVAPLTTQIPTQTILDEAVGNHISAFCGNPFHDDEVSHCAHFVGHVLRLRVGTTCRDVAGGSAEGASIRVHEIFANCIQVGKWEELPSPLNWGLIFVTNPANVDLAGKTMLNVEKKHVGIFFGGDRKVYQYKNALKKVVRQTPAEFKAHYGAPDDGLFWGTI